MEAAYTQEMPDTNARVAHHRPPEPVSLGDAWQSSFEVGVVEPVAPDPAREMAYQLRFEIHGDEIG